MFDDSETQAVATREDSPTIDGIAVWNDTEKRYDTFGAFTYNGSTGLSLDTSLNLGAFSPVSTSMLVVQPDGYVSIQTIPNYDGSIADIYDRLTVIDGSISSIESYQTIQDGSIAGNEAAIAIIDGSIVFLTNYNTIQDGSISANEAAITVIDGSITFLTEEVAQLDASIIRIDASIVDIYSELANTVKGAINVGDGSAGIYTGTITADGSIELRSFVGIGAAQVTENGNLIEISIDASFGGEVNTASNIGTGEGVFAQKVAQDLEFKSISTLDPSTVIITSDASNLYIDVSINAISDASLVGLTDTSINETELVDHTNIEYDASVGKWVETQNLWWDTSLATTTDDLGGVPQGTNLEGKTLKEILYKILYEYQPPTLTVTTDPLYGTFEKGLVATQFSSIDIDWVTTNANYPLALLNNIEITKTGSGTIFEASLGLVASDTSTYTDATGITNWGGTNRTITYNVTVDDDQADQSQPAVGLSRSFTFYYRQFWGMVDGNTNANQVDSDMIKDLSIVD